MSIDKFIAWTEQGLSGDEHLTQDATAALASGYFTVSDLRTLVAEIQVLRNN